MTTGEIIKSRREELGMSQQELAEKIGYKDRSSVNYIEKGKRQVKTKLLAKIANALEVSPSYLIGEEEYIPPVYKEGISIKVVPLIGKIACGSPILANQIEDETRIVTANHHVDFCLVAKGNSMVDAGIDDGDVIFCRRQDVVENGEIAAVLIDDGAEYAEATLKRVYYYSKQSRIILVAENPEVPALTFAGENLNKVRIIGKAVVVQKQIK